MSKPYDSTEDTMAHKAIVEKVMKKIIEELEKRAENHDASKLKDPEKICYDTYIPMLKETPFGTAEYVKVRDKMNEDGLQHHFRENRHHPEHYPNNDISHMDLVDLVEMFVDHVAASKRSDTGYPKGEEFNAKKYHYSDQIYKILMNTYEHYFE